MSNIISSFPLKEKNENATKNIKVYSQQIIKIVKVLELSIVHKNPTANPKTG